jgi:hypothetical protein
LDTSRVIVTFLTYSKVVTLDHCDVIKNHIHAYAHIYAHHIHARDIFTFTFTLITLIYIHAHACAHSYPCRYL